MRRSPKVNIAAELLEENELRVVNRSAETLIKLILQQKKGRGALNFGELIWPAIIGHHKKSDSITLRLVPLSRLGAVQGYSGNHVMIGYFVNSEILPSRPMVIKISQPDKASRLEDEANRAENVRLHVAYNADSFAIPLHFENIHEYGVLWSPFSSNKPILQSYKKETGSRLSLGIEDLWFHLRQSESPTAPPPVKDVVESQKRVDPCAVIKRVFSLLKPMHLQGGRAGYRLRKVYNEYRKYLRKLDDGWGLPWGRIWAPETQQWITVNGRRKINPLWVLDKIRYLPPTKLFCGAVHGDLHPKNIIFSESAVPHIIDFGWAAENTHIVKDFVLLECNLRFMVLRPELQAGDIEKLAAWVGFKDPIPRIKDSYFHERIEMICKIREEAKESLKDCRNLDLQYVVPLFLTSVGLLKHLRDTDNQFAAVQTVLAIAEYLYRNGVLV